MYTDLVDTKIVQIGFFQFLPLIWMVILNVRDWEGNFTQKSDHIVMATKDLWGKNSQKAISMTFGMSNGWIIAMFDLIRINGVGIISSKSSVKVARWTGSGEPSRLLLDPEQSGAERLRYIDLLAWHKLFLGDTLILHRYIFTWGCQTHNSNF